MGTAGNKAVSSPLALNSRVPFATPSAVAFWKGKLGMEAGYGVLQYPHRRRHAIVRDDPGGRRMTVSRAGCSHVMHRLSFCANLP